MSETVTANDGTQLPLSSLAQEFTYSGSFVSTITVLYRDKTYVQTFINNGTNIVYISGWITSSAPVAEIVMTDESGNIMTNEAGSIMVTQ
jgi:hypothetical protein